MSARNNRGMVLVVVMAALALMTAMLAEFAYGVYVNTTVLANWQVSQRLSLTASSGAVIASNLIAQNIRNFAYTYPTTLMLPPTEPFKDGTIVSVVVEDESMKFNLNSLVKPNGETDEEYALPAFKRLLVALELDPLLADALADWTDRDERPASTHGEEGAKNAPLESADEILLVSGVSAQIYDKLLPYVTVHGQGALGGAQININGAETPVLMSLHESMTEELAKRLIAYREARAFTRPEDIQQVAGFETLGQQLQGKVCVKGTAFGISANAFTEDGLARTVRAVVDHTGRVLYWKER